MDFSVPGTPHFLVVNNWPQHRDGKVRQLRHAFIELQPAYPAVILQIFGYAGFGDAQILSHARLEQATLLTPAAASKQIANPDAQRLTGFDVIVRVLIGIGEQQNARSGRGLVGILQRSQGARQKPAKLRLEMGDARCQCRLSRARSASLSARSNRRLVDALLNRQSLVMGFQPRRRRAKCLRRRRW